MFELYVLSILDSLSTMCFPLSVVLLLGGGVHAFLAGRRAEEDYNGPAGKGGRERAALDAVFATAKLYILGLIAVIAISVLIPSRKDLVEAYVIIEGRKVATAEGLTQAVQKLADIAEKALVKP